MVPWYGCPGNTSRTPGTTVNALLLASELEPDLEGAHRGELSEGLRVGLGGEQTVEEGAEEGHVISATSRTTLVAT